MARRSLRSSRASPGERTLLFARNFLKHPRMLGSVIPSSRYLTERVLRHVAWGSARVLVEYGPGVGVLTSQMLDRMRGDAALVVLDTNTDFVAYLRDTINDPRLHVVHASAGDVEPALARLGLAGADYIVSGIPFSTIPTPARHDILRATRRVLCADGTFIVYQFSRRVLPDLERIFSRVDRDFEPRNILPAHIYYCSR